MRMLVLMGVAGLLGGCQSELLVHDRGDLKLATATAKCKAHDSDGDCKILVNITPTGSGSGSGCKVSVLDAQDKVGFKKGAKDKWIWWQIDAAPGGEYRFTADGIAPKSTTLGWADNFKNPKLESGGREFRWKNTNDPRQAGREYAYDVKVINEAGVKCQQDPVIKNQS